MSFGTAKMNWTVDVFQFIYLGIKSPQRTQIRKRDFKLEKNCQHNEQELEWLFQNCQAIQRQICELYKIQLKISKGNLVESRIRDTFYSQVFSIWAQMGSN